MYAVGAYDGQEEHAQGVFRTIGQRHRLDNVHSNKSEPVQKWATSGDVNSVEEEGCHRAVDHLPPHHPPAPHHLCHHLL